MADDANAVPTIFAKLPPFTCPVAAAAIVVAAVLAIIPDTCFALKLVASAILLIVSVPTKPDAADSSAPAPPTAPPIAPLIAPCPIFPP